MDGNDLHVRDPNGILQAQDNTLCGLELRCRATFYHVHVRHSQPGDGRCWEPAPCNFASIFIEATSIHID
jgi:hypothetical protein